MLIFPIICNRNNQSSVSDADQEIPALGSTDNAGNSVNLVSGIIRYPRVRISLSASETEEKFYLSGSLLISDRILLICSRSVA